MYKGYRMEELTGREALAFMRAAKKYLDANNISGKGYGEIPIPISMMVKKAIDTKYITLFAIEGNQHKSGRDTAFIVSRDFQGDTIKMDQPHIRLAIGPRGSNLIKLIKAINRRVTFVAN